MQLGTIFFGITHKDNTHTQFMMIDLVIFFFTFKINTSRYLLVPIHGLLINMAREIGRRSECTDCSRVVNSYCAEFCRIWYSHGATVNTVWSTNCSECGDSLCLFHECLLSPPRHSTYFPRVSVKTKHVTFLYCWNCWVDKLHQYCWQYFGVLSIS